jgi:Zn-dependent membrane protease YugP
LREQSCFSWLVSSLKANLNNIQNALQNGMSGAEIAENAADNGIRDVRVISTPGQLTSLQSSNKTVNLSESVQSAQCRCCGCSTRVWSCGTTRSGISMVNNAF